MLTMAQLIGVNNMCDVDKNSNNSNELRRFKRTVELLNSLNWILSYQVPHDSQAMALKLIHQSETYYLSDQFCNNGKILPALEKYIPTLKRMGDLNAIDWLYSEKCVLVHRVEAERFQHEVAFENGLDVNDALTAIIAKQNKYVTASPMSLLLSGDIDAFKIFFDDWHDSDHREITTSEIDWFRAWLELYLEHNPR